MSDGLRGLVVDDDDDDNNDLTGVGRTVSPGFFPFTASFTHSLGHTLKTLVQVWENSGYQAEGSEWFPLSKRIGDKRGLANVLSLNFCKTPIGIAKWHQGLLSDRNESDASKFRNYPRMDQQLGQVDTIFAFSFLLHTRVTWMAGKSVSLLGPLEPETCFYYSGLIVEMGSNGSGNACDGKPVLSYVF